MCVCAEGIALRFGGEGDGRDDEAVYGQGGYRKSWLARADLVDVVQDEEQAGLLFELIVVVNRGEINVGKVQI